MTSSWSPRRRSEPAIARPRRAVAEAVARVRPRAEPRATGAGAGPRDRLAVSAGSPLALGSGPHGHGAETLKRTPLYDRHVAAGARLVPFAGWEMPVQYAGIREEHLAVREQRGDLRRLATWARSRRPGPDAEAFLQRILSNDVTKIADGGAQYSVLCQEDGGVLDDLFTYRLGRRTASSPSPTPPTTRRTSLVPEARRAVRRHAPRPAARLRDARRPGSRRARDRRAASPTGELPKRFRTARADRRGRAGRARVRHRLHRRGRRRAAARARARHRRLGRGGRRRAPSPPGLGARDTLRLEVCFHLYGNDLMESRGPIEAGLGWCCKEDTGFIGADAVRASRAAGPDREARRRS